MIRRHHRRGASEVVGALALLGSTVALTVVVYFWGLSITGQATGTSSIVIAERNAKVSEQMTIEEVYFTGTSVTVYTRNFGDTPVTVVSIFINDIRVSASNFKVTLTARELGALGPVTYSWTSGETYRITLASQRGTVLEKNFKAP